VFRPYNGEKISLPKAVERKPFLESIHKAQFAKLPDNFRKLEPDHIDAILKNPLKNEYLPVQEKGIKPANVIPYEIYAHGELSSVGSEGDNTASTVKIEFIAGDQYFGKQSSGVGYNVYGGGKNWSFTVEAGASVSYQWPLSKFADGKYDLNVYSANGFYRRYSGDKGDPKVKVSLAYETEKNNPKKPTGNVVVKIKRIGALEDAEEIKLILKDNAYGKKALNIKLPKNQQETEVVLNLKHSHNWYDFTLSKDGNEVYAQQYAGHVEHHKSSFTDPLMGGLV